MQTTGEQIILNNEYVKAFLNRAKILVVLE